jgi:hypothetical protein
VLSAAITDAEADLGRTPAAAMMAEPLSVLLRKSLLVLITDPLSGTLSCVAIHRAVLNVHHME